MVLLAKSFFTCRIDAQKTDRRPSAFAVQKELPGKYFALRILVRKLFLFVIMFQAAWVMRLLLTV